MSCRCLNRYKLDRPIRVSSWPPKGSGRGRGDSMARSSMLLQALETGTARIAGHLPDFEQAAVTWQQHQHQPDALAAAVIAHDVLVHAASQQMTIAVPVGSISDRSVVTNLTGFLQRRLDGAGSRPELAGLPGVGGDPALSRSIARR